LALITDIVDGHQSVIAVIGSNEPREVKLEVVITGDD